MSKYDFTTKERKRQKEKGKPKAVTEKIKKQKMKKNQSGVYAFRAEDKTVLERFLILGAETPTYYAGKMELTELAATTVIRLAKENGIDAVNLIVEISDAGRAAKNDPAIFALAICASFGNTDTQNYAMKKLGKVARTGSHWLSFAAYCDNLRGWGTGFVRRWQKHFKGMSNEDLAFQVTKYWNRDGFTQRDLFKMIHINPDGDAHRNALLHWIAKGRGSDERPSNLLPDIIEGWWKAKTLSDDVKSRRYSLIPEYRLTREMLPTEWLNDKKVWEMLLETMPPTAMIRNLAKMTAVGLIKPLSAAENTIVSRLSDRDYLKQARIHPLGLLLANRIYSQGRGEKGSLRWEPSQRIVVALEKAFYKAFSVVEPTGKNIMLAIDVSDSMTWAQSLIAGMPGIYARDAAAVMALVTKKVEPNTLITAFSNGISECPLTGTEDLKTAMKLIGEMWASSTDVSAPIVYATKNRIPIDAFIIYTDNETNCGVHPFQALKDYRKKMKRPNAKIIYVGMALNKTSNVPFRNSEGMLDIVGFDTAAPDIIRDFILSGEEAE